MKYFNKSCLDTAINIPPANSKIFLYNNATVNLIKNTYVSLGKIDESETIRGIAINIGSTITTASTGTWIVGSNLLHTPNCKVRYIIIDFTNKKVNVLINTTLHTWNININSALYSISFKFAINNNGEMTALGLGGYTFTNHITTEAEDIGNDCVFINAYKDKDGNIITSDVSTFTNVYIRDQLTLYSDSTYNGTPIHGYHMAEVEGNVIYDIIGNTNGRLIAPSITNARARYNYAYAVNTYKGFREDTESEEPISSAKIPLGKDLCIYKSAFETGSLVDAFNTAAYPCSVIDDRLVSVASRALTNNRIQIQDTRIKYSQLGRHFRVKYKITNLNALKMTKIYVSVGTSYLASYGLSTTSEANATVNLAQGESIEKEFTLNVGVADRSQYFMQVIQVYCLYESALELNSQAFAIENLEVYQTDSLKDYPVVEWGKNASESYVNPGIAANIPELSFMNTQLGNLAKNVGSNPRDWIWTNPDPDMGSSTDSGWNFSSAPTAVTTKGLWQCGLYTLYCKNHDISDLPEGVTSAVDVRMNSTISGYSTSNFLRCSQDIKAFKYLHRPSFHSKISCWIKVNPTVTSGTVVFALGSYYNQYFQFSITNASNYLNHEWFKFEFENPMNKIGYRNTGLINNWFGISAYSGSVPASIPWLIAIADLHVEIKPTNSFLAPLYADIDLENNSMKNFKLYQKPMDSTIQKNIKLINSDYTVQSTMVNDNSIEHFQILNTLK